MGRSALVAFLLGLVLAAAGCSPKKTLAPNAPPETRLFVQFDPSDTTSHTVHHEVHLYWFGSDPDGYVVAYEYRFLGASLPADPPWIRTSRPDSIFALPALEDTVSYVFEVRAIDDEGETDPSPVRQELSLRNQAPVVTLLNPPVPRDTTYASMTLTWRGIDPDGDANDLVYDVWLEDNVAAARRVTGSRFTIPSADFLLNGRHSSRPRTVRIRAYDVGGRPSAVASATWFVRAPAPDSTLLRGSLLIVDDMRNAEPGGPAFDRVYADAAVQAQPPRSYSVLRLEVNQPFRFPTDALQTFRLFDAVVWYRGSERGFLANAAVLRTYQSSIGDYVDEGGRFYLESLDMFEGQNATGILTENFLQRYAGSNGLYRRRYQVDADSSVEWGIAGTYTDTTKSGLRSVPAILRSTVFNDSLRQTAIFNGLRGFIVRDTGFVALWARDSVLSERPTFDVPIGVTVPHSGGGRFVAVTTPLVAANGFGSTVRFITKVLQQLRPPVP